MGVRRRGRLKLARDLQAMQSATVNVFRRRSADRAELLGA